MASPNSDVVISREVDAKGQMCPMPIVMVAKAIKELVPGQVLVLYATDQGAKRDVPAWASRTGNTILQMAEVNGVLAYSIQRTA
jgi:tRNA 2-thiouridine synthesizing protein A